MTVGSRLERVHRADLVGLAWGQARQGKTFNGWKYRSGYLTKKRLGGERPSGQRKNRPLKDTRVKRTSKGKERLNHAEIIRRLGEKKKGEMRGKKRPSTGRLGRKKKGTGDDHGAIPDTRLKVQKQTFLIGPDQGASEKNRRRGTHQSCSLRRGG